MTCLWVAVWRTGFADFVASSRGVQDRAYPEVTWDVARVCIVATLGMEGEGGMQHGQGDSSVHESWFFTVGKIDASVPGKALLGTHRMGRQLGP